MNIEDIIECEITDDMLKQAKEDAKQRHTKVGEKTKAFTEDRDIIGSLGEQIVEQVLTQWGLPFESTRRFVYMGGDGLDFTYDNKTHDVKCCRGDFSDKFFFNVDCSVYEHHLEKIKDLDYLIFTRVQKDFENDRRGYIYGVISTEEFLENAKPFEFEINGIVAKGLRIKSRELMPFRNYIFKV